MSFLQSSDSANKQTMACKTRSIWKMLGPFTTASRLTPTHQMSLAVLSHAACASMSTTSTTMTTCDRGDCYGPMEWAQQESLALASMARDDSTASSWRPQQHGGQCVVKWDRNLKPKLAIMRQCTSITDRWTDGLASWHKRKMYILHLALKIASYTQKFQR